jgi:hypothetical protein
LHVSSRNSLKHFKLSGEERRLKKIVLLAAGLMVYLVADGVSAQTYTAIDLTPSGFVCEAYGVSGNQQIGTGYVLQGGYECALLWNGSATNYVDLNPGGFVDSKACGISGNQQVGYGRGSVTGNRYHALLWNSSAASCIDLNPTGFIDSEADGISGNQQVGCGSATADDYEHALLWHGSAASYVDLNPTGFTESYAEEINGNQQVGHGYGSATGGCDHALLWNGNATDYIDLHQFLPAGFVRSSAWGIDSCGDIDGYAVDTYGYNHAIIWSVPEPSCALLLLAGAGLLRIGKRKQ